MVMDETLYGVQGKLQNFAVIYLGEWAFDVELCSRRGWHDFADRCVFLMSIVDITKVPDFNKVSTDRDNFVSRDRPNKREWSVTDVRVVRPVHLDVLLPVGGDAEDRSIRQD